MIFIEYSLCIINIYLNEFIVYVLLKGLINVYNCTHDVSTVALATRAACHQENVTMNVTFHYVCTVAMETIYILLQLLQTLASVLPVNVACRLSCPSKQSDIKTLSTWRSQRSTISRMCCVLLDLWNSWRYVIVKIHQIRQLIVPVMKLFHSIGTRVCHWSESEGSQDLDQRFQWREWRQVLFVKCLIKVPDPDLDLASDPDLNQMLTDFSWRWKPPESPHDAVEQNLLLWWNNIWDVLWCFSLSHIYIWP